MDNKKDSIPICFGDYKGKTPIEIAKVDPPYIVQTYEQVEPKICSKDLYNQCFNDILEDIESLVTT